VDAKTLCLGVLSRGQASGYEIKKAFEEGPFGHIHETSFGSIYPALTRLTDDGLVTCTEEAQDKRPDKKVYAITPAGERALEQAIMQAPAPDKVRSDFLFILFFAERLPPAMLARLIDRRIAWYESTLERMQDCGHDCNMAPGARFVHGMGLAVYAAACDYLKRERQHLLDAVSHSQRAVAE